MHMTSLWVVTSSTLRVNLTLIGYQCITYSYIVNMVVSVLDQSTCQLFAK